MSTRCWCGRRQHAVSCTTLGHLGEEHPERNRVLHEQRQQAAGANRQHKPSRTRRKREARKQEDKDNG